ncbi:hypothetical protein [Ralstonia pseudosolanacearum]|uniref:hypothetical protein n=1 Tax=Ralstonia pseudosolanacearum TaxID=1310165 RepID=UPI003AAFA962
MSIVIDGSMSLDEQIASIDALGTSAQQQKREHFKQLYVVIERALERGTPAKKLIAHLCSIGLQLSVNTFNKMLEQERRDRAAEGNSLRCKHCGSICTGSQALQAGPADHADERVGSGQSGGFSGLNQQEDLGGEPTA